MSCGLITGVKVKTVKLQFRLLACMLLPWLMVHESAGQSLLPDTVCEGTTHRMYWVSGLPGSTYAWSVTGGAIWPPGDNDTIFVDWSGVLPGAYSISVAETSSAGCQGDPLTGVVHVVPAPVVTFSACFDTITTTEAQPYRLKGGLPIGGVYTGPGVSNGFFDPSVAGPGNHNITYSYTSSIGCTSFTQSLIHSFTHSLTPCGQPFTDIRDGTVYPTVQIGSQCWMKSNLNFGNAIPGNLVQRDNCQWEKYCYNDSLIHCTNAGGLYQWDELMRFESPEGLQGYCPPGWHIPSEAEWLDLLNYYNGPAFAGDALKTGGSSGFDAMLNGSLFANSTYKFGGWAVFYWTSTRHAAIKAWSHGLNEPDHGVSTYPSSVQNAFYVRCLRD